MYEVLPTEPLHDVKEHISNIITEIVAHLTSEEKKLCQDTLSLDSGTREQGSTTRELRSTHKLNWESAHVPFSVCLQ